MASRIDNYPELRARIEQHLSETKNRLFNWKLFLIVMTFHVQSLKIP
ncbi:hypothetical protein HMPREF1595_01425 [Escherichia coli 907672]|nr:hypothetical protein HMPREF1595_01425 [Escherichia coli 907672]